MTTIAAWLTEDDGCYMAADSRRTRGHSFVEPLFGSKFVRHEHLTLGMACAILMYEVVHRAFAEITAPVEDVYEVMDALRHACDRVGWDAGREPNDAGPSVRAADMLLTDGVKLWKVDCTFSPIRIPPNQFAAVGSGDELAYGSAYNFVRVQQHAGDRWETKLLTHALEAAIEYDVYSGHPITHVHVPRATCNT